MKPEYGELFQLTVLQLIKYNGDVSRIVGSEFTYNDVSNAIDLFKSNGIITDLSGELEITGRGEEYLNELMKKLDFNKKGPLIFPDYNSLGRKIGKFDVYFKRK